MSIDVSRLSGLPCRGAYKCAYVAQIAKPETVNGIKKAARARNRHELAEHGYKHQALRQAKPVYNRFQKKQQHPW